MSRRSVGEGSIYQRKDGRWAASLQVGGLRRTVYGKTRGEVARKLGDIQRAASANHLVRPTKVTVAEFLRDWLDTVGATLRPSTSARYRQLLLKNVCGALGHVKLKALGPYQIQAAYASWQGQLSASTIRRVHAAFHKALADACRWRMIASNPADGVAIPRIETLPHRLWEIAEAARFIAWCESTPSRFGPLWLFLLGSGCRLGEGLGLRWSDVDFEKGIVRVERSLTEAGCRFSVGTPKTRAGIRTLSLPRFALTALHDQRVAQASFRLSAGGGEDNYVFTTSVGSTPLRANLWDSFRSACRRAGVPIIRIHDLRHVHAALAVANGADIKSLQRRLGHANISMTLGVYAYALAGGDDQIAKGLDYLTRS